MCLYHLFAHVEGHLAFEDVEALVLEMMDVQQPLFSGKLRNQYLHQAVPAVGLLPRGLDGGQEPSSVGLISGYLVLGASFPLSEVRT